MSQTKDNQLVIDCPVCKRTIWNGAYCNHGNVPEPKKEKATTNTINKPEDSPKPKK